MKRFFHVIKSEIKYYILRAINIFRGVRITEKGLSSFEYFVKVSWNGYEPVTYAEFMHEDILKTEIDASYPNYNELDDSLKKLIRMEVASRISYSLMTTGAHTSPELEKWLDENPELEIEVEVSK